ncbi:MAG: hypothetical protein QXS13_05435, partial [Acidilobaceae archaeon]
MSYELEPLLPAIAGLALGMVVGYAITKLTLKVLKYIAIAVLLAVLGSIALQLEVGTEIFRAFESVISVADLRLAEALVRTLLETPLFIGFCLGVLL